MRKEKLHYLRAFWTFVLVLVLFLAQYLLIFIGGTFAAWPWHYWALSIAQVLCSLRLLWFVSRDIRKGRRLASTYIEPILTTSMVEEAGPDGIRVDALCANGTPYCHVRIGSISKLMDQHR